MDSSSHAKLDIGMIAMLGGLALCPDLTRRERILCGSVAAGLTGLSIATDYEGGMTASVSLPTHRAFEAASGVALIAAGFASTRGRWLALVGAAQVALAATAPARAHAGPPDSLYHPLGVLKPFAENVWIVDDVLNRVLPVRMTVLRLASGELMLHSPTPYHAALHQALEEIGPVRHIVAPSVAHWMFARPWQIAVPDALTWGAPNLKRRKQVKRAGLRVDRTLGDAPPPDWADEVDQVLVRGHLGYRELAFFHRPSRTAIMTDLMQNFEPSKLPWLLRPIAQLMGNVVPIARAPTHLRAVVGRRDRNAGRRIAAWAPDRLIVTHGRPVTEDAAGTLRRSLRWLTR